MRSRKEKEAQALAASKRYQVAGFRFLRVGEEARHLDSDKERGRSSNSNSLDSVGDGAVRREALWAGVNNLNNSLEGSEGFKLGCQLIGAFLDAPVNFHRSDFVEARRDFACAGVVRPLTMRSHLEWKTKVVHSRLKRKAQCRGWAQPLRLKVPLRGTLGYP